MKGKETRKEKRMRETAKAAKKTTSKPFKCMECGKGHTLSSAKRITFGTGRCSCGGCDIDLA